MHYRKKRFVFQHDQNSGLQEAFCVEGDHSWKLIFKEDSLGQWTKVLN